MKIDYVNDKNYGGSFGTAIAAILLSISGLVAGAYYNVIPRNSAREVPARVERNESKGTIKLSELMKMSHVINYEKPGIFSRKGKILARGPDPVALSYIKESKRIIYDIAPANEEDEKLINYIKFYPAGSLGRDGYSLVESQTSWDEDRKKEIAKQLLKAGISIGINKAADKGIDFLLDN